MFAVAALTILNTFGDGKTVGATKVIVALVRAALAASASAAIAGGAPRLDRLWPLEPVGVRGVLQSAGLLFFAFAGYARIATLGEEVIEPARTIPRAIPAALALALVIYATVTVSALAAVGSGVLASSPAPLADVIRASRFADLAPVVRIGATIASLGVLLSLIAGVSRTMFAMAGAGDLPRALAAVHPKHRVPHRAELTAGAIILVLVALLEVGEAIGFSSFAVLVYYGVANASALTLSASERRWPRPLAALGLIGCALIAASLPSAAVVGGAIVFGAGVVVFAVRRVAIRRRSA
jgi:APA family basic amino acid/polyamine antiporter